MGMLTNIVNNNNANGVTKKETCKPAAKKETCKPAAKKSVTKKPVVVKKAVCSDVLNYEDLHRKLTTMSTSEAAVLFHKVLHLAVYCPGYAQDALKTFMDLYDSIIDDILTGNEEAADNAVNEFCIFANNMIEAARQSTDPAEAKIRAAVRKLETIEAEEERKCRVANNIEYAEINEYIARLEREIAEDRKAMGF